MNTPIIVGTDCTGIGSPEQALKNLKIDHKIAFACERDKYARQSYLENHEAEIVFDDITTRDNSKAPYVDLYIAGFPCQAFSLIGDRLGFNDIRGTIFFHCANYIKHHKPKAFILENVKGLLSHDKGRTFQTILNVLGSTINGQQQLPFYEDSLGYSIYFKVLNTNDFGLPQSRERIFIIGKRNDQPGFIFPKATKLEFILKDFLENNIPSRFFLSESATKRLTTRHVNFTPKINPDIIGTINEKNNSHQCSFDSGTALIVVNDNGVLSQRDSFNCR